MQQIDTTDYFQVNLLEGKVGKVSADQTKIRFGDTWIDMTGEFSNEVIDSIGSKELNPAPTKESLLNQFAPSATVSAVILRQAGENGELYWVLAVTTPIPKKKIKKGDKNTHYVAVFGCGTIE